MWHIYSMEYYQPEKEWNYVIFKKMDGTGDHHVDWERTSAERQTPHAFTHKQNLDLKWLWHNWKRVTIWWKGKGEGAAEGRIW
jgi:hypothetical protein